jgi:histidinol phosphatase-like enzyme
MFATLKPKKTVASVMASFHKTIADLSEVEQVQDAEAERHMELARNANVAAAVALDEKKAASEIRKKLEALVNA